jgi:hypothetical protein
MERKYTKMHVLFEESGSCLSINLENCQVENWLFDQSIRTTCKTSDRNIIKFETQDGTLNTYEGYVPDFFPGSHGGDYVELSISKEGIVKDLKVTDSEIEATLRVSH